MRVLIAGGGTGGHLTPALAVAQTLRDADPGGSVVVVGRRDGVAERLVVEAGFPLETLQISGVDVSEPWTVVRALSQLPLATRAARALIRRLRPDVVVGAGGYVCVPVVTAATVERVPIVLMEQNAYPGRATRLMSRGGRYVAASFAGTARALPHAHVVHTGNPLRREVRSLLPPPPLGEDLRRILVTGGSQGARRLNMALLGCLHRLLNDFAAVSITHQCGLADWAAVQRARAALPASLRDRYQVAPFFDDLGVLMAQSDLVVMRAGGSSLAECSALGRPMILVPYPHAGGHQRYNAAPFVAAGAAVLIDDAECTDARLYGEVVGLMRNQRRWHEMAEASARMGIPDADRRVVDLIVDAARDHGRRAA